MSNPIYMTRQKGATLLIGLVMLIVLTLIVISSFNFGKTNLEIVSNMQQRQETIGAAQQALELAINSSRFVEYPLDVYTEPCNGSNKLCIDVNGDGLDDWMQSGSASTVFYLNTGTDWASTTEATSWRIATSMPVINVASGVRSS